MTSREPAGIRRTPRKRIVRAAKIGAARTALGGLEPGIELYVLTHGQFSLIDALVALLEQTGPADVTLATWTAQAADLRQAAALMTRERGLIRTFRLIVDRSFLTRQPEYAQTMRELFGDNAIRTARSHAKWAAIRNESWTLAVRTSMNLNENPRLENIEVSDDPGLVTFLLEQADSLFSDQPSGVFDGELPAVAPPPALVTGVVRKLKPASTGRA
jgi:hypothetical protein